VFRFPLRTGDPPEKAELERKGAIFIPTGRLGQFTIYHLGDLNIEKGLIEWNTPPLKPPPSFLDPDPGNPNHPVKEGPIVAVWLTTWGERNDLFNFKYLDPGVRNGNEVWLRAMAQTDASALSGQHVQVLYRLPPKSTVEPAQGVPKQ
jgi:hypothetical protein